jgi:hypothetical protein
MDEWQREQLWKWLAECKGRIAVAAHGCCIGADVQFHGLVREICGRSLFIAVFPSTAKTRAPTPEDSDHVADPKPPLKRNHDIVDCGSDCLLATPKGLTEESISGTWAAIRYARKKKVPVEIFWRKKC